MTVPARTSPTTANLRWLIIPVAIGLFVLVGLAISTEDRDQFQARQSEPSGSGEQSPLPGDQPPGQGSPGQGSPGEQGGGGRDRTLPPDGSTAPGSSGAGGGAPQAVDGEAPSVEIRSGDGQVGILFGDGEPVAQPRSGDGTGGGPVVLRPDPNGDVAGLRLTEDGRLVPVGAGDIQPGDLVLRPVDGGVDLIRPDGSIVELRPGEGGTGFQATEVGADGTTQTLSPGADGTIDLGDGITVAPPPAGGGEPAAVPPSLWEQATSTPWRWIFLGIAALALVSAAVALYLHRKRPAEPFGPDFVGPAGVPADRFGEFLAMLLADDDPARAIRLAFFAAERGLGTLPPRYRTETPFEWYERMVETRPDLAEPLQPLCGRFATARFAPERPSPADRDAAVGELRALAQLAGTGNGNGNGTGSGNGNGNGYGNGNGTGYGNGNGEPAAPADRVRAGS